MGNQNKFLPYVNSEHRLQQAFDFKQLFYAY
jgi:hypothetical protein